jgi:prepilin-type N-terminal cleavage/methylation domain-containing protein
MSTCRRARPGFSLTEVLVVLALIVVLLGLLLPVLRGVRRTGQMADSMASMRQIGIWMRMYSTDNREHILPSRFDYSGNAYAGKVRAQTPGGMHKGTWSDILWTVYEVGSFPEAEIAPCSLGHDYRYDSPDQALYDCLGGSLANPFRAAAPNGFQPPPRPGQPGIGGSGPRTLGAPGFFAANNFFDAVTASATFNGWFVTGEIRLPERSLYLVDSFAGETIEDDLSPGGPYATDPSPPDPGSTQEVDFRYGGVCLGLFLDGHAEPITKWQSPEDLRDKRQIRIERLTEP